MDPRTKKPYPAVSYADEKYPPKDAGLSDVLVAAVDDEEEDDFDAKSDGFRGDYKSDDVQSVASSASDVKESKYGKPPTASAASSGVKASTPKPESQKLVKNYHQLESTIKQHFAKFAQYSQDKIDNEIPRDLKRPETQEDKDFRLAYHLQSLEFFKSKNHLPASKNEQAEVEKLATDLKLGFKR